MKLRYSAPLFTLSAIALALACGDDSSSGGTKKPASSGCDEDQVGEDCSCDDAEETTGTYECTDDELTCVCDTPQDDGNSTPTTKKDASTAKDAGKSSDAGKSGDAGKTSPTSDAGTEEDDAGSGDATDAGGDPPAPVSGDAPDPSKLPKVSGSCPDLKDGTITIGGAKVAITVGSKPGPVYLYFHGTGTSPGEINQGIPGAASSVKTEGGISASWDTSNNMGTNTGTIWYTGDMDAADQLIACGIEKGLVDTKRIHVAGYSAGGLETGAFVVGRSQYVASVIVYSGGKPFGVFGAVGSGGGVPSMVGAHGAAGSDSLGIDFGSATPALGNEVVKAGGFAIDCDDGGGHITISRLGLGGKALDFFKAHPWGVRPWTAVPSGWPSNCKVLK